MGIGKRVLLVDDDMDFLAINKMVLEKNGYEVITARNGQECMDKMQRERADLIVLDAMMTTPREGFDLSRALRNCEHTKRIPILMVSAINQTVPFRFEPDATWLPVDALIEKPIKPEQLLEEINRRLASDET